MQEYGMNERIRSLRRQSVTTEPRVSIERALLLTQTYKQYEGTVETPVLRALTLKNILENKAVSINAGELIVGEKGDGPQHAPTFPELCCHSGADMEILNVRDKIYFRVSSEDIEIQKKEIIPYWENRSLRKRILANMTTEWQDCYSAGIFTEFMEQRGPGHTVIDGKIYRKGFFGFKKDIEAALAGLDFLNDPDALARQAELQAMSICCDAIMAYGERYRKLALAMAEKEQDPARREELLTIARNCAVVPAHAPLTFAQSFQMYWFVHIGVTLEINPWDALSPGRLDQHLYPFYRKGLEEGSLTGEKAKEILECLWIKFNNQPAPPKVGVTLKESGTYTDFANINSGGITEDGKDGVNDVSFLILEVMDELRLTQPNSNVQISKKTPRYFLEKACEISRKGWGQPAFYNTEAILQELIAAGKSLDDARQGGSSGCVETGAFGKEAYILTGYFNLPKILEITLNNGYDPVTKKQIGLKIGEFADFETYEAFFDAYKKQVRHFLDIKIRGNHVIEKLYATHMPVPFLSVIVDDCIKKGLDYNAGGARYNTSYIQGVGIGTLADSLAAIRYNVFDLKRFSAGDLLAALQNNFAGYEEILGFVRNSTPKYGNDDDYADGLMVEAFELFRDEVTGRRNIKEGTYRIDMLPTTCHIYFGSVTGATPNGRPASKPVSEGISPDKGADTLGPTAVIKSVAKMDHLSTGGTLLNQKLSPSLVQGDTGLAGMASLIRTYFNLDGHHIQFNIIDRATLLKAQENPEKYRDLIVRVAGYSDYFNNLDRELQNEIIERTEQTCF